MNKQGGLESFGLLSFEYNRLILIGNCYETSSFARPHYRQTRRSGKNHCIRHCHPDAAAEKPDQGEVIAVGNGKVLEDGKVLPLDVKVGDMVLFGKYSGQTVKVDGEELLVMHESDVMAIVQQ